MNERQRDLVFNRNLFSVGILIIFLTVVRGAVEVFAAVKPLVPPAFVLVHGTLYLQLFYGCIVILTLSGLKPARTVVYSASVLALIALLPPVIDEVFHRLFFWPDARYRYLLELFTGGACGTWSLFYCPNNGLPFGTLVACVTSVLIIPILLAATGVSLQRVVLAATLIYILLLYTFVLGPSAMNYVFKELVHDKGLPNYGLILPHALFSLFCLKFIELSRPFSFDWRVWSTAAAMGACAWLGAAINRQPVIGGTYAAGTVFVLSLIGGEWSLRGTPQIEGETLNRLTSRDVSQMRIMLVLAIVLAYLGTAHPSAIMLFLLLALSSGRRLAVGSGMPVWAKPVHFGLLAGSACASGMFWSDQPAESNRFAWLLFIFSGYGSVYWVYDLMANSVSARAGRQSTLVMGYSLVYITFTSVLLNFLTYGLLFWLLLAVMPLASIINFLVNRGSPMRFAHILMSLGALVILLAGMQFQHVI